MKLEEKNLLKKVWEWKEQYGDIIINQLKKTWLVLVTGQEMLLLWMKIYLNQ